MHLEENNYKEQIDAFTQRDWQPLIELIPKVESTSKFGEWEEENILFPYCIEAPIVSQFLHIVYRLPIIISFDWGAWEEGRKISSDDDFDYDTLDLPENYKLITEFVRKNRFCDGALVSAFESGLISRILKSIENQILFPYNGGISKNLIKSMGTSNEN